MAAPNEPGSGLFKALGIELEYMIVDREGLSVLPVCDRLLTAETGRIANDVEFDDVSWSNELALHLVELKTARPAACLDGLADAFQRHITRINRHLAAIDGRLLPTAMHPWMNPREQLRLWPHDYHEIYAAFDRIFDCRRHGWANLQSVHLNLPFADDDEFGRLHAAIRLLLPILPALAASSPVVDGRLTGLMDNRMAVYRDNAALIPSISGQVIPEPVFTQDEYQSRILRPIYTDLSPHDPDGLLQDEWCNARGAIARFDRNTIEIRVLDMQECPAADLAIATMVEAVLKLLVAETWSDLKSQQSWPTEPLVEILNATIRDADAAVIDNRDYLRAFGLTGSRPVRAMDLWQHTVERARPSTDGPLGTILTRGPLARRIARALGSAPDRARLHAIYMQLAECLAVGGIFIPAR